jgi:hypothetical protein
VFYADILCSDAAGRRIKEVAGKKTRNNIVRSHKKWKEVNILFVLPLLVVNRGVVVHQYSGTGISPPMYVAMILLFSLSTTHCAHREGPKFAFDICSYDPAFIFSFAKNRELLAEREVYMSPVAEMHRHVASGLFFGTGKSTISIMPELRL